jgi:hypothetical protein
MRSVDAFKELGEGIGANRPEHEDKPHSK